MHLYAELLLHIRTVTVFASLPDKSDSSTKVRLSSDKWCLTLEQGEQSATIRLPARVISPVPFDQQLPATPSDQLTFRLPLENRGSEAASDLEMGFEILTPWSASALSKLECIHCATCRRNVVGPSKINVWKDLPSENWAEMMDFWHCHKPHVHGQSDEYESSTKGYSASNHLTAQRGVGFVDTSTFVLSPQDCSSLVKVANAKLSQISRPEVVCEGCGAPIGVADDQVSGFRISKSQVALGFHKSVQLHHYPLQQWLGALLLSAAEAQAARKFVVHDSKGHIGSLLVWMFTPDLWISSSQTLLGNQQPQGLSPCRAMKILWKPFKTSAEVNAPDLNGFETIDLAPQQFQCLEESLTQNQKALPPSARHYQDWNVSFIHRFSLKDVHLSSA